MQRVFLHIGMHKTGSSSIQRVLSNNTELLLEKGVHYPINARPVSDPYAHHLLAHSVCKQQDACWEDEWDTVLEEIRSKKMAQIILSTEGFTLCNEHQICEVGKKLDLFDVTIIVYIRNSLDLMLSRYKQQIKTGKTAQSAAQFFKDRCEYCDYSRLVEQWSSVFGSDRIRLRLYDKFKNQPGIVEDFLDLVQLDRSSIQVADGSSSNVSPSDAAAVTLRLLNRVKLDLPGIKQIRRQILRNNLIGQAAVAVLKPFTPRQLVEPKDLVTLREKLRPFAAQFCDQSVDPDDYHLMSVDS